MWRSWRLGSAFGIGIYVHWSFILLPLYVILSHWITLGHANLATALFLLAVVLAVMGCVVLHELGHALMARRFGIRTRSITLYPIGGVASLERMSEHPGEEFCIAVAGPLVNVVIALVLAPALIGLGMAWGYPDLLQVIEAPQSFTAPELLTGFISFLLASNVGLVLFNLIPAFPMDGGRVLRALLSLVMDRLRATQIATTLGMVMAVGFVVAAPFVNVILILIGGFVFIAGQMELAALRHREAQRRRRYADEVFDVVPAEEEVLDVAPADGEPGFSGFVWDNRARVWVVWRDGQPVTTFGATSE